MHYELNGWSFNRTDRANEFCPKVNSREGKEAYHIEVELPGIKKVKKLDTKLTN